MKSLIRKVVLSLVILVVAGSGVIVALFFYRTVTRPSLDRDGGTILVYELDREKQPDGFSPEEMVAALKRRLTSWESVNVTVRAQSGTRLEILIPRSDDHEKRVEQIKDVMAMLGNLEFRILANEWDDAEAFAAARKQFEASAADPAMQAELARSAQAGTPPPSPKSVTGNAFDTAKGSFTYSWVEVGRSGRKTLNLDNSAEKDSSRDANWKAAAGARTKREVLILPDQVLLFSRTCQNSWLAENERTNKAYEYFLLSRDPATDPGTGERQEIGGHHLHQITEASDAGGRPAVAFRLNDQGGARFLALTSSNLPTTRGNVQVKCCLAIILDGHIVSLPRLNSAIHQDGMITGNFTPTEVRNLVTILRAGALPATLKPLPVSEVHVEPGKANPSSP